MANLRLTVEDKAAMGGRLEAARFMAGLTIREVARKLGVSSNAVFQWEKGALPAPESRRALADLYGQPETQLFREYEALTASADALLR